MTGRFFIDRTGKQYGYLVAIARTDEIYTSPQGKKERYWLLRCKCGQEVKRINAALARTKTCGSRECRREWIAKVYADKRCFKGDVKRLTSWHRMTAELKALRVENAKLKLQLGLK